MPYATNLLRLIPLAALLLAGTQALSQDGGAQPQGPLSAQELELVRTLAEQGVHLDPR